MCGIHAVVSRVGVPPLSPELRGLLCNRGPDHLGQAHSRLLSLSASDEPIVLTFTSTVLSLRGDHVTKQPFVDSMTESVFCWNGEAWKINGAQIQGNDGEVIFSLLVAASRHNDSENAILDVFRSIEGPFALVFFDMPSRRFYFARDRLGRRSLLLNADNGLTVSSVAESSSQVWTEVEADGIYVLDLHAGNDCAITSTSTIRRNWTVGGENYISNLGVFNMSQPPEFPSLQPSSSSVRALQIQLTESLQLRVLNVPSPTHAKESNTTRVAVLFSGGLDCTILARLASDIMPADQGIDLINVAFENPRLASLAEANGNGAVNIYEACPDRVTGRKSFAELVGTCPERQWKFIAVDVPYEEVQACRSDVIALMQPHNTEMDLSIAYALYFAARGQGTAQYQPTGDSVAYSTTARVLLSGLGADELFGGYVRHATAFSRRGYAGLLDELKIDVGRLGKRNLGRDDRVMAHWGREVRFPYLDEQFVTWAIKCPVWEKCDFGNIQGESQIEPGKRILRLLAEDLSMHSVAREKKRAIQFGARTAKMESGRVKGTAVIVP